MGRHYRVNTFTNSTKYKSCFNVFIRNLLNKICKLFLLIVIFNLIKFIYNKNRSNIIFATQDFCYPNSFVDVVGLRNWAFLYDLF